MEYLTRVFEELKDSDVNSMSPGLRLLVIVHVMHDDKKGDLEDLKREFTTGTKTATCMNYEKGESALVTAKELRKLTPVAAKLVTAALWISDFKWLQGTCRTGFGSQVHFGYDSFYGGTPISFPISISLESDVLTYTLNKSSTVTRMKITSIEVPVSSSNYIFVKGRKIK